MTTQELRLLAVDPDPISIADVGWLREPLFYQQEAFPGLQNPPDRWKDFWHDVVGETALPKVNDYRAQNTRTNKLNYANQSDMHVFRSVRDTSHRIAIESRINKLRKLSSESGDPFNEASAKLAQNACEELAAEIKPAIFLLPDGNLRALWTNEARESLGVQFLPGGDLQYVILRRGRRKMLQTLGVEESVSGLVSIVRCIGIEQLWANGKR